jgi:Icc-related predicted phosphoesterase
MKLLGITDLHDQRSALRRIIAAEGQADALLLGGDLTNFGLPADAEKIVAEAHEAAAQVFALAGNCDSRDIEQRLVELGVSLYQRGVTYGYVAFQGLSAMPPWHPHMYQFTEEELAEALETGYRQLDLAAAQAHVVLSHPPPRAEIVDRTHSGAHAGSIALRDFIDRVQPSLVLCGHIHEGRGIEQIGRTTVVNCGPAALGSYAVVEIGQEVKVELREA